MYRKLARVSACSYVGNGFNHNYHVVVVFEALPDSMRKEWTFRHVDLKTVPSAELAQPYRKYDNTKRFS